MPGCAASTARAAARWSPPRACGATCRRAASATSAPGRAASISTCSSPSRARTGGCRGRCSSMSGGWRWRRTSRAFLDLDLPGSKVVVGDGPQLAALRRRLSAGAFHRPRLGAALARAYAGADVFVFPSLTDTFGLVLLEALACGTPVAAFPVTGPIDVLAGAAGLRRRGRCRPAAAAALAALGARPRRLPRACGTVRLARLRRGVPVAPGAGGGGGGVGRGPSGRRRRCAEPGCPGRRVVPAWRLARPCRLARPWRLDQTRAGGAGSAALGGTSWVCTSTTTHR